MGKNGVTPVTKQPQSYSMPLLPISKIGSQTLTRDNRDKSSPNEVHYPPVKGQDTASPGGYQTPNDPNKNYPRGYNCISCDNFCSCASTSDPNPPDCCRLLKTNFCPFIIKLLLIVVAVVLIIEFFSKKLENFINSAIEKVNGMDVTTTTKIGKL